MTEGIRDKINKYNGVIKDWSLTPPFPKTMLLEVTNICNHSCAFCANSKSNRKKGFINSDFAKKTLHEAYELGTREVGFYATGEPLIDKNLEEYITYAKDIGFDYVFITTNGALLDEQRAKSVTDAGVDSIKFSINGANKKDYLLIHGSDDFDKVISNLLGLVKLRETKERDFRIYISFILTRQTISTKEEFEKNFGKYVDDIIFSECINQSNYMHEIEKYLSINDNSCGSSIDGVCPMIFNKLHISYDGYMTLCCADFQNYLAVADVKKTGLKAAWESEPAQGLRKLQLENNLTGTICGNCLHGTNEKCFPLVDEYASIYDQNEYDKSDEIEKRILEWKKDK